MVTQDYLAQRFEENRPRLLAAAQRMLGSSAEAHDAVQEAWIRLSRSDADAVENLPAWLTTVVARVCLNLLRSRRLRGEQPLDSYPETGESSADPLREAEMADSVGLALLVVLDALSPAERLAFVLHDMFDLSFDEVAAVLDRSPAASRQLASRARRRVRGASVPEPDAARQRRVVDAYLAATRNGDFAALLEVLDPDVVLRSDAAASPDGVSRILHGARTVAEGAVASSSRAQHTELALVDQRVGLVMSVDGQHKVVLTFEVVGELIAAIEVVADPARLRRLDLTEIL